MSTTTTTPTIDFVGKSGKTYTFNVYVKDSTLPAVGGVYVFTKATPKATGGREHTVLYVGQTGDLSSRFFDHHKQDCVDGRGCTHICIKAVSTEKERLAIEKDLVDYYNPPCNG